MGTAHLHEAHSRQPYNERVCKHIESAFGHVQGLVSRTRAYIGFIDAVDLDGGPCSFNSQSSVVNAVVLNEDRHGSDSSSAPPNERLIEVVPPLVPGTDVVPIVSAEGRILGRRFASHDCVELRERAARHIPSELVLEFVVSSEFQSAGKVL